MKKLFTLLIVISAFLTGFTKAGNIEKTYFFNHPEIKVSGEYSLLSFENTLNTGVAGQPALPWLSVRLLLPPGQNAASIEVIYEEPVVLDGSYLLYPQQPSRPLSEENPGVFIIDQDIYLSNQIYPDIPHGQLTTQFYRGYSIGLTTITPVQYIPSSGQVTWYKKVTVKLTSKQESAAVDALENLSFIETLSDFIENPGMVASYPSPDKSADDYQLLIITPAQYENSFQDLIDLYFVRGIKTEVKTREFIVASVAGQDDQEKIRNCIIQEYQNHNIEFVLLGGDVEHIPYRGFYCYVQSGSGYEDYGIPADLYYGALDGNWNTDNDNRWGEPGEDDLLPEIGVARMPFSNTTDLNNMLQKLLSYQDNPVLGELRDPLLAGEYLYDNPVTWGSDYLELLIGYRTDNGYTTNGIPTNHNIDKLYEKNGSWGGSDLRARINQGRSFVHHCGHANETYVAHLYNSDITNSNFALANGIDHNFTLFFTHGCICGSFDYSDCILEKMVTIQNFAVTVIGNSRYGWFNEGQTEGPSAHLNREFVDALYNEKMFRIGEAFKEMKIRTAPWVTAPGQWEEGALRWNFYDINILGDPALGVWTDEPVTIQANYQAAIPIGVPSLQVTVTNGGSPVEDFICTVIKDGVMHGTALTDASGMATITFDPAFTQIGQADLIVTGYNCLPAYFPLTIIPNTGSYVIYSSHQIDDSQGGNGNGEADFGESILLGIGLENAGAQQAGNVSGTLSVSDTYITITDGTENFGDIPGGATINQAGAFAFNIADDVPDGHIVSFELIIESGTASWTSCFDIVINAPVLQTGNLTIDDIAGGNGNGMLDPGESATVSIVTMNDGNAASLSCEGLLSSTSPYITVTLGYSNMGSIAPGTQEEAVFQINVDAGTPVGTSVDLVYSALAGNYSTGNTFYQTVGLVLEDWESGDFSKFGWETGGNAAWTVVTDDPYEGTYCVKSGAIGDNQSTSLAIMINVSASGNISFFRKVSSESSYDYLNFYIDGSLQDQWSGTVSWGEVSFTVNPGIHTFQWTYIKDANTVGGSDCAWVDYIIFPPVMPLMPTAVPYSTNFDFGGALPEGWANSLADDMDWTPDSGGTPSSGTGPSGDHTTGSGYYVYTEASSPNYPNKTALLVTPLFDLGSLIDAQVAFWYHMYGTGMGSLHLDIQNNGAWTNDIMTAISGNQGNQWMQKTVDLTAYTGQQIRLRFRSITGSSYSSDIAIDDFTIDGTVGNFIQLDLKAFLEGSFNGTEMYRYLNTYGYLPEIQPYNMPPFNYTGTETASPIPSGDIVDWVLIELRETPGSASTAIPSTMVARKAGFILRDGTVCAADGTSLMEFDFTPASNLYAIVWHRNHLGIMSAYPLQGSGIVYSYDFTNGQDKAYGGLNAHKELNPGIWGMAAGDGNCDGQVATGDKLEVWAVQSGTSGYRQGDFNMNGNVDNTDKIEFWAPNAGMGSQVPD